MKRHGRLLAILSVILLTLSAPARPEDGDVCLECHGDPGFWEGGDRDLYVDKDRFSLSVHGRAGVSCTACHQDLEGTEDFPHAERLKEADCSLCHEDEVAALEESVHGRKAEGEARVARCRDCHGEHYILPKDNPLSMVYRANLPLNCSKCHSQEESEQTGEFAPSGAVKSYLGSVHGKALMEKGLIISAVCVDCHGSHAIRPSSSSESLVSRENGPGTCGKCHTGILVNYNESIHGVAHRRGNPDVPVCTDCHGEHTIFPHNVEASPVFPTNIPVTCSHCHDNVVLNERYGLPSKRYETFLGTYHGIASQLGDVTAANCASCHGVHDILPSSDPKSSVNLKRLPETCGKCHPGASQHFVSSKIHVEEVERESLGAYLAKKFYSIFIPSLIGLFVLFISIELYGSMRRRKQERRR